MRFPIPALALGCALVAGLLFATAPAAHAADANADLASFDRAVARCASDARDCRAVQGVPRVAPRDPWRFAVSLYGWLASTDGTIWEGGESTDHHGVHHAHAHLEHLRQHDRRAQTQKCPELAPIRSQYLTHASRKSTPTGQWSEPVTCGHMKASSTRLLALFEAST